MGNGFKLNNTIKNKTKAAGNPVIATKVLEGQDPFSIDYSGISNLDPVVISNKKISKKEQKEIIAEEKPSKKSTTWSSEPDLDDGYSAAMSPLIADFKKSVTGAMDKAAGVILNTALFAAPMPGAGLITKGIGAGAKGVSNLFRLGKSVPNPVFSTLTKNTVGPSALSNLPKLNLLSRFNPTTRSQMTSALSELAEGAAVSRTQRLATMARLSTPEGQKRLFQQELGYLQGQMGKLKETIKIPQAHAHPFIRRQSPANPFLEISEPLKIGGFELGSTTSKLFSKDLTSQALKNVGYRMKEISRLNLNERAAAAIKGGKLNFSEASKILYETVPSKYLTSNATFGGFRPAMDVGRFSSIGVQSASQVNKGNFILSGKSLFNPRVYQHELQHGLQVGRTTPLDYELAKAVNTNRFVKGYQTRIDKAISARDKIKVSDKNFFKTYPQASSRVESLKMNAPSSFKDFQYFRHGGSGMMEPRAFAAELRQSMLDRGVIKNVYQKITPNILSKAKTSFSNNPIFQGTVGGNKISGTRLLDFASPTKYNFSAISKSLNKLPAFAPFIGLGTLGRGKNK
jgi:hypothetical protein